MKYPYRQFIPEDCSLEPCVNWEIHYKTNNPFFENPITKYEDLSDEYTNLFFVEPPFSLTPKYLLFYFYSVLFEITKYIEKSTNIDPMIKFILITSSKKMVPIIIANGTCT